MHIECTVEQIDSRNYGMWGRYGRKFNKGFYFKDLDKVGDTDYGIVIFRDIV